ncbi:hypothetical protein JCM3770_003487 [Rhodotorula araucariae]
MASSRLDSRDDERTPLLPAHAPPPLPPQAFAPHLDAQSPDPLADAHAHSIPSLPPRDHALSIPTLARAAAALRAGHLPSSVQVVALCDLVLHSPLLADEDGDPHDRPSGTVWELPYGEGRVGTGALSRQGERVRLAATECVWSVRELVERRNPVVSRDQGGEWVGVEGAGHPGDGWQEFLWRCRGSKVDIALPFAHPPSTDPAASSSLQTLVELFLTSSALRALLSDLVLVVRDTADVLLETAQADDRLAPETVAVLGSVVEALTEGAVGTSTVMARDEDTEVPRQQARAHDGGRAAGRDLDGGSDAHVNGPRASEETGVREKVEGPAQERGAVDAPQLAKSAEQVKDEFIDRFKAIITQLQKTPAYQRAMQALLSVVRSYLLETLNSATPHVDVEPARPSSNSTDKLAPANPDDPTRLLLPLLEPFTGGAGSLSPLRASLHTLLSHLDPSGPGTSSARLRSLAASFDSFLSHALLSPGWIGTAASYRALGALHGDLAALGTDSPALARDAGALLSHVQDAIAAVAGDALLARAVASVDELARALSAWAAAAGGAAARAAVGEGVATVWGDVVEWVVPRVLGALREVPLPRLEFASPAISLVIDPPLLFSTSFIPSSVSVRQSTTLTYLPVAGSSSLALPPSSSVPPNPTLSHAPAAARTAYAASTLLSVEGVQLELRDVGYFAQYHTGIPCLGAVTESGLLDLCFGRPPAPSAPHGLGGLGFSLAARTPAPLSGAGGGAGGALFALEPGATRVELSEFALAPHRSSHPWIMWALRPLLRAAVRKAIEKEVEGALERTADWVARVGWLVKEREAELRREDDSEEGGDKGGRTETRSMWRWARAVWDALAGESGEESAAPGEDDPSQVEEREDDDDDDAHPAWHLHLNRHGLAVDLEAANGTVGVGTAGVVLAAGDARIPLPEGQDPPKGFVRAVQEEAQREVHAVQDTARGAIEAVGEVGEEAEHWRESVAREKRVRPESWRSEAFDLR